MPPTYVSWDCARQSFVSHNDTYFGMRLSSHDIPLTVVSTSKFDLKIVFFFSTYEVVPGRRLHLDGCTTLQDDGQGNRSVDTNVESPLSRK